MLQPGMAGQRVHSIGSPGGPTNREGGRFMHEHDREITLADVGGVWRFGHAGTRTRADVPYGEGRYGAFASLRPPRWGDATSGGVRTHALRQRSAPSTRFTTRRDRSMRSILMFGSPGAIVTSRDAPDANRSVRLPPSLMRKE